VALVTGGSAGIGEAAATALLNAGFTVYGAARRTDRMAPIAAAGAEVVALDVTDDASMSSVIEAIIRAEGRIDLAAPGGGHPVRSDAGHRKR
jgi:NADP-dependent 3-hydroxy acid dehydrogenase YdfG